MKKIMFTVPIIFALISCGNNSYKDKSATADTIITLQAATDTIPLVDSGINRAVVQQKSKQ
jgi:hypothetical protein